MEESEDKELRKECEDLEEKKGKTDHKKMI